MIDDGVRVVAGENDSSATYQRINAAGARLLLANCEDTTNTNITITAREITAADLPIVAIRRRGRLNRRAAVERRHHRAAASTPARRVPRQSGRHRPRDAHVIGAYRGLQIAELTARDTMLAGQTVRATRLRERTGLSVVGALGARPAAAGVPGISTGHPQPTASSSSPGTAPQIAALDALTAGDSLRGQAPVLIVGAGKVGVAAAAALRRKRVEVHAIDRSAAALEPLREAGAILFPGEGAADRQLLELGPASTPCRRSCSRPTTTP